MYLINIGFLINSLQYRYDSVHAISLIISVYKNDKNLIFVVEYYNCVC